MREIIRKDMVLPIIQVILVSLKLWGVIAWEWWVILVPLELMTIAALLSLIWMITYYVSMKRHVKRVVKKYHGKRGSGDGGVVWSPGDNPDRFNRPEDGWVIDWKWWLVLLSLEAAVVLSLVS